MKTQTISDRFIKQVKQLDVQEGIELTHQDIADILSVSLKKVKRILTKEA